MEQWGTFNLYLRTCCEFTTVNFNNMLVFFHILTTIHTKLRSLFISHQLDTISIKRTLDGIFTCVLLSKSALHHLHNIIKEGELGYSKNTCFTVKNKLIFFNGVIEQQGWGFIYFPFNLYMIYNYKVLNKVFFNNLLPNSIFIVMQQERKGKQKNITFICFKQKTTYTQIFSCFFPHALGILL